MVLKTEEIGNIVPSKEHKDPSDIYRVGQKLFFLHNIITYSIALHNHLVVGIMTYLQRKKAKQNINYA
jgi:hypothetical protein